jgi:hypothetical protein
VAEEAEGRRACPRCGAEGGYLWSRHVGDHTYYYWVHTSYEGGRRKVRRCYLGPKSYTYVEKLNPLGLSGALDKDRFQRYARTLLHQLSLEQKEWLLELLEAELKPKGPRLLSRLSRRVRRRG